MNKKIEFCCFCVYYFEEEADMMGEKRIVGFCCCDEPKKPVSKKSEPCEKFRRGSTPL
jgi:hypothetical protein